MGETGNQSMGRMGGSVCLLQVVLLLLSVLGLEPAPVSAVGGGRQKLRSFEGVQIATVNGTCRSRVQIYGYDCQEHTVTTKDGYILSLQRIPNGRASKPSGGATRAPVLLQHGLLMDGVTWLLNPPDESLGYILADSGYDVWIANTRGTTYSLRHTSLSPHDPAYWNWSWDELVTYDLPATLQYIYQQVGRQKIHYIGHSMGTLIAIASLASNQQQNNSISMLRSAALLSPIAYLEDVSSPVARAVAESFAAEGYYWLGHDEFDPNGEVAHKLLTIICNLQGINCYDLLTVITVVRGGTIAKYDYGNENENMKHYGRTTPPAYNVTAIPSDFPLFLSYGGRDTLSVRKDVERLLDCLKDHDRDKLTIQFLDDYAHADFVMAVNAKQSVYDPLMVFFKLHED